VAEFLGLGRSHLSDADHLGAMLVDMFHEAVSVSCPFLQATNDDAGIAVLRSAYELSPDSRSSEL